MCVNNFVLIEACSVELLVACACVRISTGFKRSFLQRDAPMRALWSNRRYCSTTCLKNVNVSDASLSVVLCKGLGALHVGLFACARPIIKWRSRKVPKMCLSAKQRDLSPNLLQRLHKRRSTTKERQNSRRSGENS